MATKTIREQIEEERAKLAAEQASVTPEETEEAAAFRELSEIKAQRAEIAKTRRDTDLARRLAVAKGVTPGVEMRSVTIKECDDTFIVRRNNAAHKAYRASIMDRVSSDKKIDHDELAANYAASSVVDWNGKSTSDSTVTYELKKFFAANSGIVGPIVEAANALNGSVTEERKR